MRVEPLPLNQAGSLEPIERGSPHVFVVGCPRSATALLQRMLDHHPQLAIACDTHFIPRVLEKVARQQLEPATRGKSVPLSNEILESVLDYHRLGRLGLKALDVLQAAEASSTYAGFISALYTRFGRLHGKPLTGEKTPDYVRWLPLLSGMFPQAIFVHLIRDGREVALSALEWATPTRGPGRFDLWESEPLAVCALWWRWLVGAGRLDGRELGNSRCYEVSYANLAQSPEAEFRPLCEFLQLPYAPEMVTFHRGRVRANHGLSAKSA